jgi:regulator of protease activity HflC (stomatin/prohibitin superfamily)
MDVTTIFAGVVLLLAFVLLISVIKIVPQGREFTVERFGKLHSDPEARASAS